MSDKPPLGRPMGQTMTETASQTDGEPVEDVPIAMTIYVAGHCPTSVYALETAAWLHRCYPTVQVQVIDLEQSHEPLPETVFATPTYLINDRVWSLGNPSHAQLDALFTRYNIQPIATQPAHEQ